MTTVSHRVIHVNAETLITRTVLHEDHEPIHALACHPSQSTVAIGNQGGVLKMWDYNTKVITGRKVFKTKTQIQCVTFDPAGEPKNLYVCLTFGVSQLLFDFVTFCF